MKTYLKLLLSMFVLIQAALASANTEINDNVPSGLNIRNVKFHQDQVGATFHRTLNKKEVIHGQAMFIICSEDYKNINECRNYTYIYRTYTHNKELNKLTEFNEQKTYLPFSKLEELEQLYADYRELNIEEEDFSYYVDRATRDYKDFVEPDGIDYISNPISRFLVTALHHTWGKWYRANYDYDKAQTRINNNNKLIKIYYPNLANTNLRGSLLQLEWKTSWTGEYFDFFKELKREIEFLIGIEV